MLILTSKIPAIIIYRKPCVVFVTLCDVLLCQFNKALLILYYRPYSASKYKVGIWTKRQWAKYDDDYMIKNKSKKAERKNKKKDTNKQTKKKWWKRNILCSCDWAIYLTVMVLDLESTLQGT